MTEAVKKSGGVLWLLLAIFLEFVAMIIALIVLALIVTGFHLEDNDIVAGIGWAIASIGSGAGIWYVFDRTFVKLNAPKRRKLYFAILMLTPILAVGGLLSLAAVVDGADEKAQKIQDAQNTKLLLADIKAAEDGAQALKGGYVLRFHLNLPDEAGRLDQAARDLVETVSKANAISDESAVPLDLPYVLEPKQLAQANGFATARARLAQSRSEIVGYDRTVDAAYAKFRAALAGARLDAALKRRLLADHDRRTLESRTRRGRAAALEIAIVAQCEAALNELEQARGSWRVDGDRMTFDSEGAERKFRAHISTIDLLGHQLAQL